MNDNSLKIKKRGEDGSRIISVRIKEDILNKLDNISKESNYSRNELINLILQHGVENLEIIQQAYSFSYKTIKNGVKSEI